jgi:hypothetical protein
MGVWTTPWCVVICRVGNASVIFNCFDAASVFMGIQNFKGCAIPMPSQTRTVVEAPTFQKQADKTWSETERLALMDWLATHPLAGEAIPGSGGARKAQWFCWWLCV